MSQIDILLPKMGESVAEATIIKWLKSEGDRVEADEPIVEIATDKVDSEVPAPEAGILLKRLVNDGDVVKVGQPIAQIGSAGAQAPAPAHAAPATAVANGAPKAVAAPASAKVDAAPITRTSPSGKFYSPLVRNIAQNEGVSLQELEAIAGTGQGGRVTKKDILDYLPNRGAPTAGAPIAAPPSAPVAAPAQPPAAPTSTPAPTLVPAPGDEIIEMDRMRKLIADHMVMSKRTSPHVTSFVEADVTTLVLWREKVKKLFEQREGEKITFTPIFIMAIAQAIKEMPLINIQVDGQNIIKKKDINIGMAAALPTGNLIVPVIKNADQLNLVGLTKKVNDLANRARAGKLQPDDIQGGTYTVTNVGTFGNVLGTPVINQPQVAIMATGAIRKKPAVIETPQGDMIGIRHMMFLSHSYDHRVVDGALGGRFVRRVADILENWSIDQSF
ncbi:MAG: 2-oxo acid dehydrogenase subunit E2 [Flavobacteriales bacterium]|jgi:2-oxoglutarate dehydrogenase E2 component (dihydrolipoamide succinyltransferase)|nr:MAG: 2-oxo acid dehydrogenase subunit E2 [Flavobacteriales bacterium]